MPTLEKMRGCWIGAKEDGILDGFQRTIDKKGRRRTNGERGRVRGSIRLPAGDSDRRRSRNLETSVDYYLKALELQAFTALILVGHARVGLEDNLNHSPGVLAKARPNWWREWQR